MSDFEKIAASMQAGLPSCGTGVAWPATVPAELQRRAREALLEAERAELRDRFAIAAATTAVMILNETDRSEYFDSVATSAYRFADAMLKAREAK